jgi:hypothetical protein
MYAWFRGREGLKLPTKISKAGEKKTTAIFHRHCLGLMGHGDTGEKAPSWRERTNSRLGAGEGITDSDRVTLGWPLPQSRSVYKGEFQQFST